MTTLAPDGDAPPGPEVALWMRGVGRRFGDLQVLSDIDLEVPEGHLWGLVGPSGCGKTTLARIAVGLLAPTEGEVRTLDVSPGAFGPRERQRLGYLPQEFSLYPMLTVQQNARFVAGLYGMGWLHRRRRIREVLRYLDLWDARRRLAQDVSGGMKRRLSLACALLHEPRFLVVDEPTAGLDPVLRMRIRDLLRDIQSRGTTVFLTTQIIEEAEYCDGVAVMRAGRVVAAGSPAALRSRAGLPDTVSVVADGLDRGDLAALWDLPGVQHVRTLPGGRAQVVAEQGERAVPAITDALRDRGRAVTAIDSQEASFEDVFLRLVEDARVQQASEVE
ncbi:MAG: ABC transporter ATP-binding protein [Dehalococcoidia bacterium]|nr:ABC transporter ATP-binding protein [Dehalococcoidia bacterium]